MGITAHLPAVVVCRHVTKDTETLEVLEKNKFVS
jgi:hypothetical protein